MLVTSDWHLDDDPRNEYRWAAFEHLGKWLGKSGSARILHLGDLTDRKDRHSAALVNRMVTEFEKLLAKGARITILMGNHDMPLNGPPYWGILNAISDNLTFLTKPHALDDMLLFPYAENPAEAWADIMPKCGQYKVAFIHQTVTGVKSNNGFELENPKMVAFPPKLKVYSGDIHTTQVIRKRGQASVQYIGAPHPVAFGDDYPPQMIELDVSYDIKRVIAIPTIQKLMLRIEDPEELEAVKVRAGDQARVICGLDLSEIEQWPGRQDAIRAWANNFGVELFSIEPDIQGTHLATEEQTEVPEEASAEYVLRLFADAEEIDDSLFSYGAELLKEAAG